MTALDFSKAVGSDSGANGLLWIDLETTGTEVDEDCIIEIGAILTDFKFNMLGNETFSCVVTPDKYALGRMMMEPAVLKMHMANGLLQDILDRKGVSINKAENEMLRWLDYTFNAKTRKGPISKYRFILAGSGVGHFDKKFIAQELPNINNLLAYPILDVGMVRRFLRFSGIQFPSAPSKDDKNHRALDDIRLHLEEACFFKERLREALVLS